MACRTDDKCDMSRRSAQIIGGIGRTLIGAGLLVMAFAVFQLWGTGLQEERAQGNLTSEFDAQLALIAELQAQQPPGGGAFVSDGEPEPGSGDLLPEPGSAVSEPGVSEPGVSEPAGPAPQSIDQIEKAPVLAPELAEALRPKAGDAMGRITIPKIDVVKAIVHGVRRSDLRDAPGHYPDTVFPGQAGNAAIAGHRTTYGSPFGDLDLLEPGDQIVVETLQGKFFYEVLPYIDPATGNDIGHQIVTPYDVEVLEDQGDNRLTLTACHPKFSARQRIVVSAKLVSEPAEPLPELAPIERPPDDSPGDPDFDPSTLEFDPTLDDEAFEGSGEANGLDATDDGELTEADFEASLGWQMEELPSVLLWALATFAVGVCAYVLGRKWRRIPAYAAATVPFLAMLWVCFEHLDRLLPAF